MPSFICFRCGKCFQHKGTFSRHLNNIKICSPILSEKTPEEIKKYFNIKEKPKEECKKKYKCPYCSKKYVKKANFMNHINHFCSKSKLKEKDFQIKNLKNEIKDIKKDAEKISDNKDLNAFGNEDITIDKETIERIIKNPIKGIPNLIKKYHFDIDNPNNNNIRLGNKKCYYIDIYNGKFWEAKEKSEIIHQLIISKKDMIDDYFETNQDMFTDTIKKYYQMFSDKIDRYVNIIINKLKNKTDIESNDKELYNKLYKEIELIMINAQRILKIKI